MRIPEMFRDLIDEAKAAGFTVHTTGKGHLVLRREGSTPIFMSSSPSDWRAAKKARAVFRRIVNQ